MLDGTRLDFAYSPIDPTSSINDSFMAGASYSDYSLINDMESTNIDYSLDFGPETKLKKQVSSSFQAPVYNPSVSSPVSQQQDSKVTRTNSTSIGSSSQDSLSLPIPKSIISSLPTGIPALTPQKDTNAYTKEVDKRYSQQQPIQQSSSYKTSTMYDNTTFNKQFEQQQALQQAQNYIRQMEQQIQQQREYMTQNKTETYIQDKEDSVGYFERIFSKKKEFMKLLQWSCIILFAITMYYFIDHYLQQYISANDMTFERELLIRSLVPLSILFIMWNLRVFSKP